MGELTGKERSISEARINEVIKKNPKTLEVFTRFSIDSCCGGARTIREAAQDGSLSLEALVNALKEKGAKDSGW